MTEHAPDQHPTVTLAIDGCVVSHFRGMLVGAWAISSTLELVAEQEKVMTLLCARVPKFSSVHLVIKQAALPSAEVRTAYQDLLRSYGPRFACSAVLLEGDGFWASAVRAFMTGVSIFERRIQMKAFGHVEPLAAWLAPIHSAETGVHVGAEELQLALDWLLKQPTISKHRGT